MRSLRTLVATLLAECVQHGECLLNLTRTPSQDYATIGTTVGVVGGHRLVWELNHGEIPDGHDIHHRCENPRCLNIEHLELHTHGDHRKIHHPLLTHCSKHGVPFYKRGDRNDGRCRICDNETAARYRERHREKVNASARQKLAQETLEQREHRLRLKRIAEKKRRERLGIKG